MKKTDLVKLDLPDNPGVYFFRDEEGNILYIGKATSLRSRTRSYFASDLSSTRGLRIVTMVTIASFVTYIETSSVLEALMLESVLIKKHKPPYNVREKDDKSYACIVVTREEYPRILALRVRDFEKTFKTSDTLGVFGPFTSMRQVIEALRIIRKIFPFRDKCEPDTEKLCFNAQIGLCPGMCASQISKKEYGITVKKIMKFLSGETRDLIKTLEAEMNKYAKNLEFEKASYVRNTIFSLKHIKDSSLIIDEEINSFKSKNFRIESFDVAHISGTNRVGVMCVIDGGEKNKSEYRKFKLVENVNDDYSGLRELLTRRLSHHEWRYPDLIVIDGGKAHKEVADRLLASKSILIPTVAVVKNERHKPQDILGDKNYVDNHKKDILLANHEAHRFAITYHKTLRNKIN